MCIFVCIYHTKKKINNDGNQKLQLPFRRIFPLILSWFWPFYVVFWRFASFLAILRRFCPLASFLIPKRRQPVARMPRIVETFWHVTWVFSTTALSRLYRKLCFISHKKNVHPEKKWRVKRSVRGILRYKLYFILIFLINN